MSAKEAEVHFKGILANVDSSILQMNFGHGFKIESFSEEEAVAFFSRLEKIPRGTVVRRYFFQYQCLNNPERRMYVVSNLLRNALNRSSVEVFNKIQGFDATIIEHHLEPTIRLMRLFKEGDIRMPVKFYYRIQREEIKEMTTIESGRNVSHWPFHLEVSEIPVLRSFIKSVELPFKKDFLQLAFENFELSHEVADTQLAFLVLMIGIETLLNPSEYEIGHRVSRNMAVLLGKNKKNSEEIFAQGKKLYGKRSTIVHSGKRKIIEKEDLFELRNYLREAIKKMHCMGKGKSEIMALLDSHGFGQEI